MMIRGLLLILAALGLVRLEGAVQFSWPTPNTAYREGLGFDAYVQPTVSGTTVSGLYGCVRTNGTPKHFWEDTFKNVYFFGVFEKS